MKMSRRGILAGLLVAGATAPAAAEPVELPKPTFIKGQIMPRTVHHVVPLDWRVANSPMQAVTVIEYEIYDGKKFVPLYSGAGQDVVRELGG